MSNTNMTKVTAPDITCGGCASSIRNAFGRVEGVSDVAIDVSTKEVCVTHNDNVTREKVIEVLDRAGFPAE